MKELSASDAARHFSEVLDEVEHGESFVINRRGKPVASIQPAKRSTWADVKKIMTRHPRDPDWIEELRELRASLPVQEREWPD